MKQYEATCSFHLFLLRLMNMVTIFLLAPQTRYFVMTEECFFRPEHVFFGVFALKLTFKLNYFNSSNIFILEFQCTNF